MTPVTEDALRNKIDKCQRLYQKNLAFFKERVKVIYEQVIENTEQPEIGFDSQTGRIQRLENGQNVYSEDALDHALHEVENFFEVIEERFYAPIASNLALNNLIKPEPFARAAKKYELALKQLNRQTLVPVNMDIVVFGVGIGYHIEMLCNKKAFNNITIIEKNVKNFKVSMFAIDWEQLITGLTDGASITLHIDRGAEHTELFETTLKNHCHRLFPSIGLTTVIYNHFPDASDYDDVKAIIEEYSAHIKVSSEMIGPEAQRLFNANENIKREYPCIDFDKSSFDNTKHTCIVGAGPSLDIYAETIKENREHLFLISAGSSLSSLLKLGIKPDLHFELEFQNLATDLLQHINENDILKEFDLVCTYEACPGFPPFFRNAYMFIPESSELQPVFGEKHTLRRGGITCTNGAVAFLSRISDQDIYLIGLDFAYTGGSHHSNTNISMEKELPDSLARIRDIAQQRRATVPLESTMGGQVYTSTGLNSARITMESLLKTIENQVYNCSHGAKILGSDFMSLDHFMDKTSRPKTADKIINSHLELANINKRSIFTRTKALTEKSIRTGRAILKHIRAFPDDPKQCNNQIKKLFAELAAVSKGDIGQYRNIMSVSRYPLIQLYIFTAYMPSEILKDITETWIEEYESYLDYLENIFNNANNNQDYLVTTDWVHK